MPSAFTPLLSHSKRALVRGENMLHLLTVAVTTTLPLPFRSRRRGGLHTKRWVTTVSDALAVSTVTTVRGLVPSFRATPCAGVLTRARAVVQSNFLCRNPKGSDLQSPVASLEWCTAPRDPSIAPSPRHPPIDLRRGCTCMDRPVNHLSRRLRNNRLHEVRGCPREVTRSRA